MNHKLLVILPVSVALLVSCGVTSPRYTRSGVLRDTIFSLEERGNGAIIVWLTHDDDGVYCIGKSEEKIDPQRLIKHDGEAIIKYKDIAAGDQGDGCRDTETNNVDNGASNYQIYKVVGSVELVEAR